MPEEPPPNYDQPETGTESPQSSPDYNQPSDNISNIGRYIGEKGTSSAIEIGKGAAKKAYKAATKRVAKQASKTAAKTITKTAAKTAARSTLFSEVGCFIAAGIIILFGIVFLIVLLTQ